MRRRGVLAGLAASVVVPAFGRGAPSGTIAAYEAATGGHVGLFARHTGSGRTLAWRAHERFVMCSTFKASLAAFVLGEAERGRVRLDERLAFGASDIGDMHAPVARANLAAGALPVAEMCRGAVEESDNVCADKLLDRVGGPAALTAWWRAAGDGASRLDDAEPLLNRTPPGGLRDTTTPAAMAATFGRMALGPGLLRPASRAMLVGWLIGCRTGANRLRAGLPPGWTIGDKTGNNAADAAGDLLVAWPRPGVAIVAAVYTRGGTPTPVQLDRLFLGLGREIAALA